MNKQMAATILFLAFILTLQAIPVRAVTLGVKSGDWILYSYEETSFLPSAVQSETLEFLNVAGDIITVRLTFNMSESASINQTKTINMSSDDDF